jgi:hypothetical protein
LTSTGSISAGITTSATAISTAAPSPTNAASNSTSDCASWYTIQSGDYCQAVSIRQSISLTDFYFLNPGIDANCTNLELGPAYCVEAVGSISTYSGYPTTSPLYTLTPSTYTTTTATFSTTTSSITPVVTLALADGTRSDCDAYVQYVDVPAVSDQTQSNTANVLTSNINNCDYIAAEYLVDTDDFIAWNPSLASLDTCALQASYRYCALNSSSYDRKYFGSTFFHKLTRYKSWYQQTMHALILPRTKSTQEQSRLAVVTLQSMAPPPAVSSLVDATVL